MPAAWLAARAASALDSNNQVQRFERKTSGQARVRATASQADV
jgi:hypothetical protein